MGDQPEKLECGRSFFKLWVSRFVCTTWRAAEGLREHKKPSIHAEILKVDTRRLAALEGSLNIDARVAGVKQRWRIRNGLPWRREWASRKQLQRGLFLVPFNAAVENHDSVIMPMDREAVRTPVLASTAIIFTELQCFLEQHVQSCWYCFTSNA